MHALMGFLVWGGGHKTELHVNGPPTNGERWTVAAESGEGLASRKGQGARSRVADL
jgi:hypothetical protein